MLTHANKIDARRKASNNRHPMECKLAFVADAANDAQGKLNVLGIFDQLTPKEYPYLHPQMCLVVSFQPTVAEYGRKREFEISLIDPDGRPLTTLKTKGTISKPEAGRKAPFQIILRMVNTPFPKAGPYEIAVLVDGDQKASVQIEALPAPKPSKRRAKRKN